METFIYLVIVMATSMIAMIVSSSKKPVHPMAYFIGNGIELIFIAVFLIVSLHHHAESPVEQFCCVFFTILIAFAYWYQCHMLARRVIIKDKVYEMEIEYYTGDGSMYGFIREGLFSTPAVIHVNNDEHLKTGETIKVKYHGCYEGKIKYINYYNYKTGYEEKKFIYFTVAKCD